MDAAAIVVSIVSLVVSAIATGAAVFHARRADLRASSAEGAATRAEERAARAEEREQAVVRVVPLQKMLDSVHEIAHSTWAALSGEASALPRIARHRARLQAILAETHTSLPITEVVAAGGETYASGFSELTAALAELDGAIARELVQVARPSNAP